MNILITNDDGIHAPGIQALIQCVPSGIKATVVAPASERSACSHSISLGQKLRIEEFKSSHIKQYAVHGTPADCVKFAIGGLKGFKPDVIFSGINQGANTGVSVYYSGTISAAREGFINRVPAVALSLCSPLSRDFTASTGIARALMEGYAAKRIPLDTMLNVNIPPVPVEKIRGVKLTKQASSRFIEEFIPEKQHKDKKVFTLAGEIEVMDADGTSDEEAVSQGYISITPLKLDLTDYRAIPLFQDWIKQFSLNGERKVVKMKK